MKNSLETLAATPPKLVFRNWRESHEKIQTLETALGLSPGKPILNIRAAAGRIAELESKLAARNAAAVAPVVAPSAAAPADYQPDPNLSADAQIAAAKAAGVVTTPGGQRLRSQRAALSADMGKLRGTSLECANQILKK
jgi:nucleoid-associated protein YgaU